MHLIDRAADEREAQAERFFAAVGAVAVGRGWYRGSQMYVDRSVGAAPVYIYADPSRELRQTEYWLLSGGSLLPRREDSRNGGYSGVEMHHMILSGDLALVDEIESDLLSMKWALAAGETVETVVLDPAGLTVHESHNSASPARVVEVGTAVRIIDSVGEWALVEASEDSKQLGWMRHSLANGGPTA